MCHVVYDKDDKYFCRFSFYPTPKLGRNFTVGVAVCYEETEIEECREELEEREELRQRRDFVCRSGECGTSDSISMEGQQCVRCNDNMLSAQ